MVRTEEDKGFPAGYNRKWNLDSDFYVVRKC